LDLKDKKVLVVGTGNSGGEISIDLIVSFFYIENE